MIEMIINNWQIIVGIICIIIAVICISIKFLSEPSDKQMQKVREWLIEAVQKAEEELGSGTGQKKLRLVYERFTIKFPFVSLLMDFEMFSFLVDEALDYVENKLMEAQDEGE